MSEDYGKTIRDANLKYGNEYRERRDRRISKRQSRDRYIYGRSRKDFGNSHAMNVFDANLPLRRRRVFHNLVSEEEKFSKASRGRNNTEGSFDNKRHRGESPLTYSSFTKGNRHHDDGSFSERQERTLFVTQLSSRVGELELRNFFQGKHVPVRDVRVIKDNRTHRSKGSGYVELKDAIDIEKALDLTGTMIAGIPIIVQRSESERNYRPQNVATQEREADTEEPYFETKQDGRVFINNLAPEITADDLKVIFQEIGNIKDVTLSYDKDGKPVGIAFIQYYKLQDARRAEEMLQDFDLAGRKIGVRLITERVNSDDRSYPSSQRYGRNENAGYDHEEDYIDDDDEKPKVSASDLMKRLSRSGNDRSQSKNHYVLFSNVFNLEEEKKAAAEDNTDWINDIKEDILSNVNDTVGHCSQVTLIEKPMGEIFLTFDNASAAEKTIEKYNGRMFGQFLLKAQMSSIRYFDTVKSLSR